MPKISIKEIDNTQAGTVEYQDFAVVVPGFLGTPADDYDPADVFDDNGVYECSSQADFVNYVGCVDASADTIGAVAANMGNTPAVLTDITNGKTAQQQFDSLMATSFDYLYKAVNNPTASDVGYLRNASYKFYKVSETDSFESDTKYVVYDPSISGATLGSDKIQGGHYGNQIAYELLGLGYTVLYKKLTDINSLQTDDFWEPLYDKSEYDFRYLLSGLISVAATDSSSYTFMNAVNNKMIAVADFNNDTSDSTGRGDCVALCDIDDSIYVRGNTQSAAISAVCQAANAINASKYAAIFVPAITYNISDSNYSNSTFPATFHYLACAAKARANNFAEWYAVGGYTRGVSDYAISGISQVFGEKAISALEPRSISTNINKAVNVITKVKSAYYLWGNRTAATLSTELTASHFLNIRQLCSTVKKEIYTTCRQLTFDPNSDILWLNFCNSLRPTLERMKADQGVTDYKFVKVATTKKATLKAKVKIVPIEAVEDFSIDVALEDSVNGTEATISE